MMLSPTVAAVAFAAICLGATTMMANALGDDGGHRHSAHQRTSPYHRFTHRMLQTGKLDDKRRRHMAEAADGAKKEAAVWDPEVKEKKICNIMGGLDLTRLRSSSTRALFKDGIEDVELMREVVTESMFNGGLKGGLSDLTEMAKTIDWEARGLSPNATTLTSGLGWVDDRPDRRMERQVTTPNQPLVGDKWADAAFTDTVSNFLPWIRDRRAKEGHWYKSHQNGRTEGVAKHEMQYDSLYIGVWLVTMGDAIWYYPPISVFAHPYTMSDIMGGDYSWRVYPAEPVGWPFNHTVQGGNIKDALYDPPYADVAHPGLSMISAMAPVYYTGSWFGYDYNDTFLGAVGVDIALDSIANVLDDLEDALAEGSFALLADANTFKIIAMSQSVVDRIYPEFTGMEEERVTYDTVDGTILEDRRNQPYKVSDTIWQGLLDGLEDVSSPHWRDLHEKVQATEVGGRGHAVMNLTIRDSTNTLQPPEPYYAMFERWDSVAEWVVLVFAPVQKVEQAIRPQFSVSSVNLEAIQGEKVAGDVLLTNEGSLNVIVSFKHDQDRIKLAQRQQGEELTSEKDILLQWDEGVKIKPGQSVPIAFEVDTSLFGVGNFNTPLFFHVEDDGYPDCLHSGDISFDVSLRVSPQPNLNQLGGIRIAGLFLAAIAMATALGFTAWVGVNRKVRVVVASQPIFLVMISAGCFILASAVIPMSIDDGVASQQACNIACMATPWTVSVGFVTTFSALYSKIKRVNMIFSASNSFKRLKVTEKDVMKPFAILATLNFIVLLCWTLIDPLLWVRKSTGEYDSYGSCEAKGKEYIVFLSLVGVINLVALLLACAQAYRARDISDEFSETKFIGIAIGAMLQVLVIGVPLLFIVKENPPARFFMQTTIVFVISMAVVMLIFLPKVHYMKNAEAIQRQKSALTSGQKYNSMGHNHSVASTASEASDNQKGIAILGRGTAALEKENHELNASIDRLKLLLEQHNIDPNGRVEVAVEVEGTRRGLEETRRYSSEDAKESDDVKQAKDSDDVESPPQS